jgi:hypothetical protein
MNKDQLALEAAQSSFAKISQLSLFKYMNWWAQVFRTQFEYRFEKKLWQQLIPIL